MFLKKALLTGRHYYSHLVDKVTEAPRGLVKGPKAVSC